MEVGLEVAPAVLGAAVDLEAQLVVVHWSPADEEALLLEACAGNLVLAITECTCTSAVCAR